MKKNLLSRLLRHTRWGYRDEAGFDTPDELVKFAQTHFSDDFPNPVAIECPPQEALSELIHARRIPPKEMRVHLLSCSECFRYYRTELSANREINPVIVAPPRDRVFALFLQRPVLILTLALLLLLSSGFAVFVWFHSRTPGSDIMLGRQSAGISPSASTPVYSKESSTSPDSMTASTESEREAKERLNESRGTRPYKLIAENKINIDLEAHTLLRGANRTGNRATVLTATPTQFEIKLPSGSPKGAYKVTIADPFGESVRSSEGLSDDGSRLRVHLNLVSVKPGKYLVCISRQSEVPDCVPAIVVKKP